MGATTQIKDGYQGGSDNQLKVNSDGSINVNSTGGGGGGNASVGATGVTAPTSATELGAVDGSGNLQPLEVDNTGALKVSGSSTVTGDVTPSGLRIAGRITTMAVSTTAVELPATPLANRNAMAITNLSNQTLYIGFSSAITADDSIGTTAGWEVGPSEGFNIDVQGSIPIYGIVASGTITIKVMELS